MALLESKARECGDSQRRSIGLDRAQLGFAKPEMLRKPNPEEKRESCQGPAPCILQEYDSFRFDSSKSSRSH